MAIRIPIISDFQDAGIKQAKIAFGNFKTAIKDAEGGLGKFKAGATSVMDSVAAHAGTFAIAGGLAFGKFAASGIKAFTDLALQAGRFADATGLELTKASGYIEVAGDIGVPIDAVESAIGRLNKTIGADPDKVRNLGVDLVYLRDGSLDVNETFLNTIDRIKGIKDPAERARTAAQLLGKGWQSMAELIMGGSDKLNASLKSVSEQKLITPEELQMAKDYRAAMTNLGDKVEDVKIKTGEKLVKPATWFAQAAGWVFDLDAAFTELGRDAIGNGTQTVNTDLVDIATNMRDARAETDLLKEAIRQAAPLPVITNTFEKLRDRVKEVAVAMSADAYEHFRETQKKIIEVINPDKIDNYKGKFEGLAGVMGADAWEHFITTFKDPILQVIPDRIDRIKESLDKAVVSTDDAKAAWGNLIGQFERQVSFDKLDTDIDTLKEKAIAAFGGGKAEMDAFHEMQLTVATDFQKFVENFPPALSTEITVAINSGDIAQLEYAASLVKFVSSPIGSGGNDPSITRRVSNPITGARASGGPVMGGKSYLVGEKGPELFTPGTSGNITANGAMGGATVNVTVTSANPDDVVSAIQKWVRQNGSLPLAVTSGIRY